MSDDIERAPGQGEYPCNDQNASIDETDSTTPDGGIQSLDGADVIDPAQSIDGQPVAGGDLKYWDFLREAVRTNHKAV